MFLPRKSTGSASSNGAVNGSFMVLKLDSNTIGIGSTSEVQPFPPASLETNLNREVFPVIPSGRNSTFQDLVVPYNIENNTCLLNKEVSNSISKNTENVLGNCIVGKKKRELQNQSQDSERKASSNTEPQMLTSSSSYKGGSPPEYLVNLLSLFGWRVESDNRCSSHVYVSPNGAHYGSLSRAFNVFLHRNSKSKSNMFCSSHFIDSKSPTWDLVSATTNLVRKVDEKNICRKDCWAKKASETRFVGLSDSHLPVASSQNASALPFASNRLNCNLPRESLPQEYTQNNVRSLVGNDKLDNKVNLFSSTICQASETSQSTKKSADVPSSSIRSSTRHKQKSYHMDYDLALEMEINEEWKSVSQEDNDCSSSGSEFNPDSMLDCSTDDDYLDTRHKSVEENCLAAAKYDCKNKCCTSQNSRGIKTRRSIKFNKEHIVADSKGYEEDMNRSHAYPNSVVNTRKRSKFDPLRVEVQNKDRSSLSTFVRNDEDVPFANKFSPSVGKTQKPSYGKFNLKNKKMFGACGLTVRRKSDFASQSKSSILSWLINSGTISENEMLVHRETSLKGLVTQGRINCSCCSKSISLFAFQAHARGKPSQLWDNIYLTSGKSVLQCLMEAWKKEKIQKNVGFQKIGMSTFDANDDTCGICGDGGSLICCDTCPSTFHQECLKLKTLPEGRWYCPHCTCKFCMSEAQNSYMFGGTLTLYTCFQCGRKYHLECAWEHGMNRMVEISVMFCGTSCSKVDSALSNMLGVVNPMKHGLSWTLLKCRDDNEGIFGIQRICSILECNAKLSMALTVLNECFIPLVDPRTRVDMLSQALYNCGSNFKRLSCEAFYTAILEKDDEIITVASLRIHGDCLAEMPFIGTRPMYQRQGMCHCLLQAIEDMLRSLSVKRLVIPAVPDLLKTWMTSFAFKPLEESLMDEIRNLNMMVFAETTILKKDIIPP